MEDNQLLTRYIHGRRKKEEAQKKVEEEAQKRRRRRPEGRTWWWPDDLVRAKAPRMPELGRSSPPRVVQGLSLLLLAIIC
jgi:hypothetical protein